MKPWRVLVVTGGFPLRSETFVRDHLTGLLERGADVTVLALHPGDGSAWDATESRLGVEARVHRARIGDPVVQRVLAAPGRFAAIGARSPLVACRLVSPRRGWRGPSGVLLAAASALGPHGVPHRFDRIHAEFGPSGVVASLLRRAGFIEGPLSCAFYGYDATRALLQSGPALYRGLFEDADLLLPNSRFLAGRLLAAGAPASKVTVHLLGVDMQRFAPVARDRHASDGWKAIAIGRFVPKKGFATLLQAMAMAGDAAPQLTIIGDGPLAEELRGRAASLGVERRVRFAGWLDRERVRAELAATDALIAPSETAADGDVEGMPVVVMEAMASGLPVIGTDHSGIPEIVVDGVNGVIVPERDAAALASAIVRMADPSFRIGCGQRSRERAEAELDHAMLMSRLVRMLGGPG